MVKNWFGQTILYPKSSKSDILWNYMYPPTISLPVDLLWKQLDIRLIIEDGYTSWPLLSFPPYVPVYEKCAKYNSKDWPWQGLSHISWAVFVSVRDLFINHVWSDPRCQELTLAYWATVYIAWQYYITHSVTKYGPIFFLHTIWDSNSSHTKYYL